MTTFDSPEIKAKLERDKRLLTVGKIDWESILIPIVRNIDNTKKQLSFLSNNPPTDERIKQTLSKLDNERLCLKTLICEIQNTERNNRIEALVAEIKTWEYSDCDSCSWKDVALSMLRYPEKIVFDYDICPYCKNHRLKVYFSSPEWTWSMNCAVAGDMIICTNCKQQYEFIEKVRT